MPCCNPQLRSAQFSTSTGRLNSLLNKNQPNLSNVESPKAISPNGSGLNIKLIFLNRYNRAPKTTNSNRNTTVMTKMAMTKDFVFISKGITASGMENKPAARAKGVMTYMISDRNNVTLEMNVR